MEAKIRTTSIVPTVRMSCEDCDTIAGPSERVAFVREEAAGHARRLGHRVFVEKTTGTVFEGRRELEEEDGIPVQIEISDRGHRMIERQLSEETVDPEYRETVSDEIVARNLQAIYDATDLSVFEVAPPSGKRAAE